MTKLDLKQQTHDVLCKLNTLADEIRVRIHLGGMDLREKWNELEPQLRKAERSAHNFSDEALASLTEMLSKAENFAERLRHGEKPAGGAKSAMVL